MPTESVEPPHQLYLFGVDDELTSYLGDQLIGWMRANEAAILIFTREHLDVIEQRVEGAGIDLAEQAAKGHYVVIEARQAVADLLRAGGIASSEFEAFSSGPVARALASGRPAHVIGEVAGMLWEAGMVGAAMEIEDRWGVVAETFGFTLECTYPASDLYDESTQKTFERVAQIHTSVLRSHAVRGAREPEPKEFGGTFPAEPGAPRAARQLVLGALDGDDERLIGQAVLVTSELAANVVRHSGSSFILRVRVDASKIRVAVSDMTPLPKSADRRIRGEFDVKPRHGLDIVGKLASAWGIDSEANGKTVWAELSR